MADDNQVEQNQPEPVENTTDAPDQTEIEAREQGWVPKEEYTGDENKWIDAKEFVSRKPLFEKISKQSKELKEQRKAIDQLVQVNIKTRAEEFNRALAVLKAQKKEAFTEGDPDKIVEIEDSIDAVKEQRDAFLAQATRDAQEQVSETPAEFTQWTNRNTWYNTSKPMKAYADAEGRELARQGKSPSEVLEAVEKLVRKEFPQHFHNANRDKPGAVEGTGNGGAKRTSYNPSPTERAIAERFVASGTFKSVEDYYKQLKELNNV